MDDYEDAEPTEIQQLFNTTADYPLNRAFQRYHITQLRDVSVDVLEKVAKFKGVGNRRVNRMVHVLEEWARFTTDRDAVAQVKVALAAFSLPNPGPAIKPGNVSYWPGTEPAPQPKAEHKILRYSLPSNLINNHMTIKDAFSGPHLGVVRRLFAQMGVVELSDLTQRNLEQILSAQGVGDHRQEMIKQVLEQCAQNPV